MLHLFDAGEDGSTVNFPSIVLVDHAELSGMHVDEGELLELLLGGSQRSQPNDLVNLIKF